MTLYLDTSSLVKLYVEETGSDTVRQLTDHADVVVTASIAYAEARAALARKRRERALTAAGLTAARTAFDSQWPSYCVVPTTPDLCLEAGGLAERYSLRGFDSLHLAAFAEMLRALQGQDDVMFSSFDDRLDRAAKRLARTIG